MVKVIMAIIVLSVLCRWALGKWPWEYLRAPTARDRALARARALLGVQPEAEREAIITAHRRLTALVHPDKGGTTAAMQEANAARDMLLGQLPSGPAIPADDDQPSQSQD